MKKLNRKGFTLIELLAVITILGILMLVAIPAVSRTIENSRRDTFADNTKTYINTVRNAVLADELKCTVSGTKKAVSGVADGTYYLKIDTAGDAEGMKDLMEKVAKSSWGNAEVLGYVKWVKSEGKIKYYAFITDTANHGMYKEQAEEEVNRSAIAANVTKVNKCGSAGTSACAAAPAVPTDSGAILCELDK